MVNWTLCSISLCVWGSFSQCSVPPEYCHNVHNKPSSPISSHNLCFVVSVTYLEILTYPSSHAMHQQKLIKWYEFKSNEAIWENGQSFSVSTFNIVQMSSLEPRSPVWNSVHLSSSAIWMFLFPKIGVILAHYGSQF